MISIENVRLTDIRAVGLMPLGNGNTIDNNLALENCTLIKLLIDLIKFYH